MGKKMGINTKAAEARERKEAQKRAKNELVERKKQDEFWRDDDKHVNRKLERQKERDLKAQEERERKLANKVAYEREMELAEQGAKAKLTTKQQLAAEVAKVTRHDIQKNLEHEQKQQQPVKELKKVNPLPIALVPNLNRVEADGENASSIDQALDLFKSVSLANSNASAAAAAAAAASLSSTTKASKRK